MNILILSDTHGHVHPEILSLADDCEHIVHCGDIGNADVLRQLSQRAALTAVKGNNDLEAMWAEGEHAALQPLPWETELSLPGGQLGVCHGHQEPSVPKRHDYLRSTFSHCRMVAYGHSHLLVIDKQEKDCCVINPGAAGRARTHGGPSCLVLQATENDWSLESYRFEL